MIPTPQLPVFGRVRPHRLLTALKGTKAVDSADGPPPPDLQAQLQFARMLVNEAAHSGTFQPVERKALPALMYLIGDHRTLPEARVLAVQLVLHSPKASYNHYWQLYQLLDTERDLVIAPLAKLISRRLRRDGSAKKRIPAWLRLTSEQAVAAALRDPANAVGPRFVVRRIALTEFSEFTKLIPSRGPGLEVALGLINHGTTSWWKQMPPQHVRAWATDLASPQLVAAVADRQLCEFGAGATRPSDLKNVPERSAIRAWVQEHMGDPLQRRARWDGMSSQAVQVYRWMIIAEEIARILEEFKSRADHERYAYWNRRAPKMIDGRFYDATDVAVCMMVIDHTLIIEFGHTGHACYWYRTPESAPPLAALSLPSGMAAREFKRQGGLELDGQRFQFLRKGTHHRGWEQQFDEYMAMHGTVLGRQRR